MITFLISFEMRGFILSLFCSPQMYHLFLGILSLGEALKGKELDILAAREKAVSVCLACTDGQCFVDTSKVDSEKLLNACGTLFVKPKKFSRTQFFMASKISNAEIKYSIDKKGRGNVGEIKFGCAWDNPEQVQKISSTLARKLN